MIARYVLALVVIGLAWFVMVQIAMAAEQREPFQWALVMALPAKPQEVAGLYVDKTTCDVDAWMPPKAPSGTVFSCKPIERRKP
ncbi:MAG: hypothetical protein KGS44_13200 [Alphaproteobacteria bacterium]|nr:hypothetical protein [Alphaproteobacteria bacterium]